MAAPKSGRTAKKAPEDRLGHRTKAEIARTDVLDPDEAIDVPEAPPGLSPNVDWHPVATAAWTAFLGSPIRGYYEDTDLVHAWVTCELISRCIAAGMTAGQSQHLRMYMNDLGFSESARRDMDIAIKRTTEKPDPKKVIAIDRMKARQAAGG